MIIKVKLHPNSSQEKIKKINDSEYEIWIREKPLKNKANAELVKMLKKHFKKDAKIKSGFASRNKVMEII